MIASLRQYSYPVLYSLCGILYQTMYFYNYFHWNNNIFLGSFEGRDFVSRLYISVMKPKRRVIDLGRMPDSTQGGGGGGDYTVPIASMAKCTLLYTMQCGGMTYQELIKVTDQNNNPNQG